ncbi:ABC transporter ATP-binding protein [Microbispora corallina]|uniref:ABC transporter ATP-binding protein n=1 Tax=Microbispora corallina TaxID=83302 RepID=A0ABQ4FZ35_9ACTN|nr:ABC transporter ATP-binding protein [Microbispora corallina]GIH40081.1 ABC transporter ATP-binding protein [Microbispora corallina]
MSAPIVEVTDLHVAFGPVRAVRGVSLAVRPGECVALVGESGSGKSVTARTLIGLTGDGAEVRAASLAIEGEDATRFGERRWRTIRGTGIGYVLQDALVSLDPLRPVGKEIAETLRLHRAVPRGTVAERVVALLREVGVPEPEVRAAQYPHELSGGLRQRALIASAIACGPRLLIADEPTTALDVTVQAQILRLLAERKRAGTAVLLISHDLAVVAELADRVLVMKEGEVVEEGPVAGVLRAPAHPYTRALLDAIPAEHAKGTRLSRTAAGNGAARPESTAGGVDGASESPPRVPPGVTPGRAHAGSGTGASALPGEVVIRARDLAKAFGGRPAVAGVSFELRAGETLGVVGESGSGKTTTARLVLGLLEPDAGEVEIDGRPWRGLGAAERRELRRHIQVVYQDPLSSFDPRFTVRRVLDEALAVGGEPRAARRDRAVELLEQVGLDAGFLERRPRHLSGGQRQRVAVARALAPRPRVIVCDEPVSALDVSIQAQVLDLLADLQASLGVAYLFISHHLGVIHHVSDRVLVMKDGRIVESGDVRRVFTAPQDPYTKELLAAVPRLEHAHGSSPHSADDRASDHRAPDHRAPARAHDRAYEQEPSR